VHIAVDGRSLQLPGPVHGPAAYLRGWVEAAQSLDTPLAFSLLYDPEQPRPGLDLRSPRWEWRPLDLPFGPQAAHSARDRAFVFDSALESFLLEHDCDLFLASGDGSDLPFSGRRLFRTRWVISLLDPAPPHARGEDRVRLLGAVVYAQRVQTASRAAQTALAEAARTVPDKIDIIPPGVSPLFAPLPSAETRSRLAELGLSEPYILSVAGPHGLGDLSHSLAAYALLPEALRQRFRLALWGEGCDREQVHKQLVDLSLQDRIYWLERPDRSQQAALYSGATLVVYLPQHDPLGLPLLAAMRCGAPVVAAAVAPLAETANGAAVLVSPHDPTAAARQIERLLRDDAQRGALSQRGQARAAAFTWSRTATAVLDSLERAAREPLYSLRRVFPASLPHRRSLRLAFWTPLNPHPSGISEYSLQLVTELGRAAEVDIFVDGYRPSDEALFDSFPIFDAQAYSYLARRAGYDLDIYQVGNNPLHRYMYESILSRPGLVTLHDLSVYHLVHAVFQGQKERFWREVAYSDGPQAARQARQAARAGTLDPYRLLLNKRLVESSRGVVVHSRWAAQQIKKLESATPVRAIPMGVVILEDDGGRFGRLVRRLFDLPADGFIFGIFGKLHPTKRITVALRAFARLRRLRPQAVLFLNGPLAPLVRDELSPFLQEPRQAREAGVYVRPTEAGFEAMLMSVQAVDVGLNLRYPTAGETSWTLHTLLGQGKPTIVSNVGSYTDYPDTCCPKTPVGGEEEEALFRHMLALMDDPVLYRRASQAAYAYSRDKTWPLCAQHYLDFIETILREGGH